MTGVLKPGIRERYRFCKCVGNLIKWTVFGVMDGKLLVLRTKKRRRSSAYNPNRFSTYVCKRLLGTLDYSLQREHRPPFQNGRQLLTRKHGSLSDRSTVAKLGNDREQERLTLRREDLQSVSEPITLSKSSDIIPASLWAF